MTFMEKFIAAILVGIPLLIGMMAFIVSLICFNAFVLTQLWLWFVVPFFGFVPMCIPVAIGLTSICTFLSMPPTKDAKFGSSVIFRPLIVLLFGWIVHSYFMPTDMKPMWNFNTPPPIVAPAVSGSK